MALPVLVAFAWVRPGAEDHVPAGVRMNVEGLAERIATVAD